MASAGSWDRGVRLNEGLATLVGIRSTFDRCRQAFLSALKARGERHVALARFWRSVLVVSMSLCLSMDRAAAAPSFHTWTVENGLPQNSVYDILQTRDGYLWLATFGGLVRYDGVRFVVFKTGNTRGIESSRFTKLFEAADGALWAVSEASGLTRYHDGVFTTYSTRHGLPHESIQQFTLRSDARGGLAMKATVGHVRWADGRFSPFSPGAGEPFADVGHPTNTGAVWHVAEGMLQRVFRGRITHRLPAGSFGALDDPKVGDRWIRTVYEDRDGGFWFCALDGRVQHSLFGRSTDHSIISSRSRDFVQAVHQDRHGTLWFGLAEGGLARLENGSIERFTVADGLPADKVYSVFEDAEGSLWIGTANGLAKLQRQVVTTYDERDGLTSANVYSVYEDRRGTVWVGAWPGLTRYQNGRFTPDTTPDGVGDTYVTSIFEDAVGTLWVGTWSKGVKLLRDGKASSMHGGHAEAVVQALYHDRRGAVWVGTRDGLTRYGEGTARTYRIQDGLPGNIITNLFEDRAGTLWIATQSGLAAYRDGRITDHSARWGLTGYMVRGLHEDRDGTLWVGTYDAGLFRIHHGKSKRFTTADGLFDDGVFQILEDDDGFLWLSSNLGISRVSKQELAAFAEGKIKVITAIAIGKADGLANPECNGGGRPAGIRTRDGRMWFPTQGGVAVLDPKAVQLNPRAPRVVVEAITLDGRQLSPGSTVNIPAGARNLEIAYTAPSFVRPEQVRFQYRLEGLDSHWVDAGARRTAYYPHLPAGRYEFRVIAANSDGIWNREGAAVAVSVAPPFWRTWWFAAVVTLAAAALLLLAHRLSLLRLRRRHRMQEAFSRELIHSQDMERKRIAAELHDSLGQELLAIKNQARLGMRLLDGNAAAANEHLDEISSSASRAIEEVREIAFDLHPYQLEHLGLTRSIEAVLARSDRSSGVRFDVEIDRIDDSLSKDAALHLYRIVQESVNNILKHSGASDAAVRIKRQAGRLHVSIRDNGSGFTPNARLSPSLRRPGMGLMGIEERTRMLGGHCRIRSAPGEGTTIAIDLVTGSEEARS